MLSRVTESVRRALGFAAQMLREGSGAAAVEAIAAAALQDIQHEGTTFLRSARESGFLGDRYAEILRHFGAKPTPTGTPGNPPYKLGFVIFTLAEGQAASTRLVRILELLDRDRFDPVVIVADDLTRRSPPQRVIQVGDVPSRLMAGRHHKQIKALGVPLHYVPLSGDVLFGATDGVDLARSLGLDVAVFIASPACPISTLMAYARIAPVQINQNIGIPLVVPGIDAVTYHSPVTAAVDEPELTRRGITCLPMASAGTDVTAAEAATPVPRTRLGVPEDAVLLAVAGNRLPERLSMGDFLDRLAALMAKHPQVWLMTIGGGDDLATALAPLKKAGVGQRVVHAGPQPDIRPWLKAADVFLNEYPEGGSNTVMEAMACRTPAIAMHASEVHTHHHGAVQLGEPWAVMRPDADEYWRRVERWTLDAAQRQRDGEAQYQRARDTFDYPILCRQYEQLYTEVIEARRNGARAAA